MGEIKKRKKHEGNWNKGRNEETKEGTNEERKERLISPWIYLYSAQVQSKGKSIYSSVI